MTNADELAKAGKLARIRGEHAEALRCYVDAMAAFHEAGDLAGQMHHGRHAADLHRKLGNLEEAHVLISVTVGFYRENPPSDLELANALRIAALVDESFEDDGRCAALWREAASLYEKVGVQEGVDEAEAHLKALTLIN